MPSNSFVNLTLTTNLSISELAKDIKKSIGADHALMANLILQLTNLMADGQFTTDLMTKLLKESDFFNGHGEITIKQEPSVWGNLK